jgi:hypothetical protein
LSASLQANPFTRSPVCVRVACTARQCAYEERSAIEFSNLSSRARHDAANHGRADVGAIQIFPSGAPVPCAILPAGDNSATSVTTSVGPGTPPVYSGVPKIFHFADAGTISRRTIFCSAATSVDIPAASSFVVQLDKHAWDIAQAPTARCKLKPGALIPDVHRAHRRATALPGTLPHRWKPRWRAPVRAPKVCPAPPRACGSSAFCHRRCHIASGLNATGAFVGKG